MIAVRKDHGFEFLLDPGDLPDGISSQTSRHHSKPPRRDPSPERAKSWRRRILQSHPPHLATGGIAGRLVRKESSLFEGL